jgi:hypothetical protein
METMPFGIPIPVPARYNPMLVAVSGRPVARDTFEGPGARLLGHGS